MHLAWGDALHGLARVCRIGGLVASGAMVVWAGSARAQAQAEMVAPGVPAEAAAEPQADGRETDAAYLELVEKALAEYELGNWSEAKSFFKQAHALQPNARTLRGLGMAAYELRSYVEAIGYLRAALESEERPLTDAMRSQLSELLQQALTFVARYELGVEPADAELRVDGLPVTLQANGTLLLDPGPHELLVSKAGHQSVARRLVAIGNQRERLEIMLPSERAGATSEGGFFATRTTRQWVGLGLGTAGVAGLGVSLAYTLVALSHKEDSEANCEGERCNDTGLDQRDDARAAGNVATVALAAGGALLVTGVVLYLTGGEKAESKGVAAGPPLRWLASAGPDHAMLSLAGAWQ